VEQSVQGFSHNPQIGIDLDAELNWKLQKRLTGTCHTFGVENRRKSSHFLGDYCLSFYLFLFYATYKTKCASFLCIRGALIGRGQIFFYSIEINETMLLLAKQ
jgi:hypothetical protein